MLLFLICRLPKRWACELLLGCLTLGAVSWFVPNCQGWLAGLVETTNAHGAQNAVTFSPAMGHEQSAPAVSVSAANGTQTLKLPKAGKELRLNMSADVVRPRTPVAGQVLWSEIEAELNERRLAGVLGRIGSRVETIESQLDVVEGGVLGQGSLALWGASEDRPAVEVDGLLSATIPSGPTEAEKSEAEQGRIVGITQCDDGVVLYFGSLSGPGGEEFPAVWIEGGPPFLLSRDGETLPGMVTGVSKDGCLVGVDREGAFIGQYPLPDVTALPELSEAERPQITANGSWIVGGRSILKMNQQGDLEAYDLQNFDFSGFGELPDFVAVEIDSKGQALFVGEYFDVAENERRVGFWDESGRSLGWYVGGFGGLVWIDDQPVVAIQGLFGDSLVSLYEGQSVALSEVLGDYGFLTGRRSILSDGSRIAFLLESGPGVKLAIHDLIPAEIAPELVDLHIDTNGDGAFDQFVTQTKAADFRTMFRNVGKYQITAVAVHQGQELARISREIQVVKRLPLKKELPQSRLPGTSVGGGVASRSTQRGKNSRMAAREGGASGQSQAMAAFAQTTTIEILAAGETNDETIQLLIDGVVVRTWNNLGGNANNRQFVTLTHSVNGAVTPDQIRIAFVNDDYVPANNYDRNVRIDAIVVNGVRYETEAPQVYSTGTWKPGDGVVPGFRQSEYLHTNGYFRYANVGSILRVRARGDVGGERFDLQIDGVTVASFNTTAAFQTFSYQANIPVAANRVRIVFTNDDYNPVTGLDYNLRVDYLEIDQDRYEAEAASVYSTGTWISGVGVVPGYPQSEYLHTNGFFHFDQAGQAGEFSLENSVFRVAESAANLTLNVVRRNGDRGSIFLDYRTVDVTAVAGRDYTARSGRLTFADGETVKVLTIPIINNNVVDGDREFIFTIDNVSGNGSLRPPRTATITIEDDDRIRSQGTGLLGEYFDDLNFTNRFLARIDSTVNFNWGTGAPATGMTADNFTVRWTGRIEPRFTGLYTFRVRVDDGVRLWVNNQLIIDRWIDQSATVHTGTISLQAGVFYDIRMEYYERLGSAVAELSWQSNQQALEIIPASQLYPAEPPPVTPGGNLQAQNLITGLSQPTTMDFSPDGSLMYIAEQRGIVRVVQNGVLLTTPFLDFRDRVNGVRDRGLLGLAVHPSFPSVPYVYLLYTYDPPQVFQQPAGSLAGPDGRGNRAGRLTRVTADAATNYTTIVPNSEVVVLGNNSTWQNFNAFVNSTNDFNEPPAGILPNGTNLQDFINSDSESHTIGDLAFGPDGALYVSIGDGTSYNQVDPRTKRVQDVDNLSGKILRIDPLTGNGLPSNPFFNGNPAANRSKVFQYGLRNPFRISVHPGNGRLFIGDVGWGQWEELNSAPAGANFGWPWYEGGSGTNLRTGGYQSLPEAQAFYAAGGNATPAIFALNHSTGINAIVGGDVYWGQAYPPIYQGNVFFNDLGRGIVSRVQFNANGSIASVSTFANNHRMVVKIKLGPDGLLYFVDLDDGLVGRWRFVN